MVDPKRTKDEIKKTERRGTKENPNPDQAPILDKEQWIRSKIAEFHSQKRVDGSTNKNDS